MDPHALSVVMNTQGYDYPSKQEHNWKTERMATQPD